MNMNIVVQRDPFLVSMNTETRGRPSIFHLLFFQSLLFEVFHYFGFLFSIISAEKWFHLGWLFFQLNRVCRSGIPSMLEICCFYGHL